MDLLSGSGAKSMTQYPSKLIKRWEKNVKSKAVVGKRSFSRLVKARGCLIIFVVWTMFAFLSLFRHDYRVVLLLSDPSQSQNGPV